MKKNTLIEVEWDDIYATCSWYTDAAASSFPICRCKSVGYFLNRDKTVLRLSPTIQTGKFSDRDVIAIPVGCIAKVRRLKH